MPIQTASQPHVDNLLLAGLMVHERNAVQRASSLVTCEAGQVLLEANGTADCIFFPIDSVLAPVRRINGSGVDLGLVGHEGVIGCDSFVARRKQLDELVVRSGGRAYRMPAEDFRRQFDTRGGLHSAVLRFTSAFMLQLGQNAVCSRYHRTERRVARWLLMVRDRAGSDIELSAESLSLALGTSQAAIAEALERLSATGAIHRRRDIISGLEPEALEIQACDCYDELRQAYEQALPA